MKQAAGRPKDLEKRAAILAAAKRLFPLAGFEGTSMDAVAEHSGVSKATIYKHWADKDALIIEVMALIAGFALAKSLTGSVHELFAGTERVRQGDFTHASIVPG